MKIIFLLLMFCIIISATTQKASAQEATVSFQIFYDDLSPYGTWVESSDYGYVWVPNVDPGFIPYATNGYWVYTDDGWTWVSNYPWGWAPFHYGRWYTDATYGPIWVPDYEWSPGWVTWRRSGDYYGWAPIGPGISLDIAYSSGYSERFNRYTFVGAGYMGRKHFNKHFANSSDYESIYKNSEVINNTRVNKTRNVTYHAGPDKTEVAKRVAKPITPVAIKERSKPGQNLNKSQLQIYRPQVQKNISTGQKPIPAKVEKLNNVKPLAQRTVKTRPQKANQTIRQQPTQPSANRQPAKQQQSQPKQQQAQPPRQQTQQPQRANPPQNQGGEQRHK